MTRFSVLCDLSLAATAGASLNVPHENVTWLGVAGRVAGPAWATVDVRRTTRKNAPRTALLRMTAPLLETLPARIGTVLPHAVGSQCGAPIWSAVDSSESKHRRHRL